MRADVVEAQRAGSRISTPSTPCPRGRSPIAARVVGVDAARDEALELARSLVEDADRRVAGAGQLARHLQELIEHRLDLDLRNQAAPASRSLASRTGPEPRHPCGGFKHP